MHGLISVVATALLLGGSVPPLDRRGAPPSTQAPTARCSAQGTSVIRVRLLNPAGGQLTVPANAVIVAPPLRRAGGPGRHCGTSRRPGRAPSGPGRRPGVFAGLDHGKPRDCRHGSDRGPSADLLSGAP
jgi:hypothetical protein